MIADRLVSILQVAHVCFNGALLCAFVFQGSLGWRIRRKRLAGVLQDFSAVKRHRALGPVLAALLPIGYLVGLSTTYLSKGLWVRYPAHFSTGSLLLVVVCSTFLVSRGIRGVQSPWRTPHYALGLLLLCVFSVQLYLGLDIFL